MCKLAQRPLFITTQKSKKWSVLLSSFAKNLREPRIHSLLPNVRNHDYRATEDIVDEGERMRFSCGAIFCVPFWHQMSFQNARRKKKRE